jgi:hypothetical protein
VALVNIIKCMLWNRAKTIELLRNPKIIAMRADITKPPSAAMNEFMVICWHIWHTI